MHIMSDSVSRHRPFSRPRAPNYYKKIYLFPHSIPKTELDHRLIYSLPIQFGLRTRVHIDQIVSSVDKVGIEPLPCEVKLFEYAL